ncbi:MAG: tripartite tricarboxylate transporter TctB family protein [Deltaproteobacteria bacterium]|nr:tripartite tricarboxylate transporter TctB family protein [Deltaproteobacteria bacterium]
MTRRVNRVVAIIFILIGAYVLVESHVRFPYTMEYGPGPGFLPTWLGICMLLVSFALLTQTFIGRNREDMPDVRRAVDLQGGGRVLTVLLMLTGSVFLFDILGFLLSYGLLVFSVTYVLERDHLSLRAILMTSVFLPATFALIFRVLLGVSLPGGILGV